MLRRRDIILVSSILVGGLAYRSVAEDAAPTPPANAAASKEDSASSPSKPDMQVLKMVICQTVTHREPGDAISNAKVGDVVYAWTQVQAESGEEKLTHRWMHGKDNASDVALAIKASPYRTWSKKTLSEPGSWTVQALDSHGTVLQEKSITVNP